MGETEYSLEVGCVAALAIFVGLILMWVGIIYAAVVVVEALTW